MARPAPDALVEPRRIVVVRGPNGGGHGYRSKEEPPAERSAWVAGVGTIENGSLRPLPVDTGTPEASEPAVTVVAPADLEASVLKPEDLLVLDVPAERLPSLLRASGESGAGLLLLPGDPGDHVPAPVRRAIGEIDAPVLGPGATLWIRARVPKSETGADVGSEPAGPRDTSTAVVASDPRLVRTMAHMVRNAGARPGPVVAVGVEADLTVDAVAAALAEQPDIGLVLGRAERVRASVVESLRASETETPVAVFPGNGPGLDTDTTADVPGSRVSRSLLEQAGAVPVESLERMVDGAPALSTQPTPSPASVVVVSNAGGPGVMGIDAVGVSGLEVADLADETVERLETLVPDHGSARNPLDLLADSGVDVFETVLDHTLADENVGAAVVLSAPSAIFSFERLAEIVVAARRRHELPIVTALMGGSRTDAAAEILARSGITNYFDPYRAVGALDLLRAHAESLPLRARTPAHPDEPHPAQLRIDPGPGEPTRLTGADATEFARSLGVGALAPDGDPVVEMFVEAVRCPERGPVVATGVTAFAETVGDIAVRAVPVAEADARDMLAGLRAAPILQGARGRTAADTGPVVQATVGLSELLARDESVGRVSLPGIRVTEDGIGLDSVVIRPNRE